MASYIVNNSVPDWANLPLPALENVYLRLERKDQIQMSLTCRRWSQEYTNPRLWRDFEFIMEVQREDSAEIFNEVRLARRFGSMFRKINITWKKYCSVSLEPAWKQIKLFLRALTEQSQLKSFSFLYMSDLCGLPIDDEIYGDFFQSILNLLLSQNRLKYIQFQSLMFVETDAAELFRVICVNNCQTLRILKFMHCIMSGDDPKFSVNMIDARSTYDTFMNLQEMELDYSQIFETMIIIASSEHEGFAVRQRKKGSLERMRIICGGNGRYQRIPSNAWKCIVKKCPALKIELFFLHFPTESFLIETFVVRHMPITMFNVYSLDIAAEYRAGRNVGPVLQHLLSTGINAKLEHLTITPRDIGAPLARDLKNFLQNCPNLKVLGLDMQRTEVSLDTLLEVWNGIGIIQLEGEVITIVTVPRTADLDNNNFGI